MESAPADFAVVVMVKPGAGHSRLTAHLDVSKVIEVSVMEPSGWHRSTSVPLLLFRSSAVSEEKSRRRVEKWFHRALCPNALHTGTFLHIKWTMSSREAWGHMAAM